MEIKNPLRKIKNKKIQYLIMAITISIIIVMLLIGLYLTSNYLLAQFRVRLIETLEQELSTEVEIGEMRLESFNRVKLEGFSIKDYSARDILKGESITMDYSFVSFIFSGFDPLAGIKRVDINQPHLNLVEEDGIYNFETLIDNLDLPEVEEPALHFLEGNFYINQGQIDLESEIITDSLVGIEAEINPGETVNYLAQAQLKSQQQAKLRVDANSVLQDYEIELELIDLEINRLRENLAIYFLTDFDLAGEISARGVVEGKIGDDFQTANAINVKNGFVEYLDYQIEDIAADLRADSYGLEIESLTASVFDSAISLSGDIFDWSQPEIYLDYQIEELSLAEVENELAKDIEILADNQFDIEATADLSGEIIGDLENPEFSLRWDVGPGEFEEFSFTGLKGQAYYNNDLLNLVELEIDIYQGIISASGDIILADDVSYLIDLNISELELNSLTRDLLKQQEIDLADFQWLEDEFSGNLVGGFIISGKELTLDKMDIIGNVKLSEGVINGYQYDSFNSDFWLSNQDVLLNNTALKTDKSNYSLEGVIGLDGDLNLIWEAENVHLSELTGFHQQQDLNAIVNSDGILNGELSDPQVDGDFEITDFSYDRVALSQLEGRFTYFAEKFVLDDVLLPEINTNLFGKIDFNNQESFLDISVNRVGANDFKEVVDFDLQVSGDLYGEARIESFLSEPQAQGAFFLETASINGQSFDKIDLEIEYIAEQIIINNLSAEYNESYFEAYGSYQDQLDIEFNSEQFHLDDINYDGLDDNLAGKFELVGRVYGPLDEVKVRAETEGSEIKFNDYSINSFSSGISFRRETLYINDAKLRLRDDDYQFNAALDLNQQQINNLLLTVEQGAVRDINQFMSDDLQFDVDHKFSGVIRAHGPILNPRGNLDITVYESEAFGYLNLEGDYWLGEGMEFDVEANDFDLSEFNTLDILPYEIAGKFNLTGQLTGNLEEINLDSNFRVADGQLAGLSYQELGGRIRVLESNTISIEQRLEISEGNVIRAYGQIPIKDEEEFDLNLDLAEGNLSIFEKLFPEVTQARGRARGSVKLTGTLAQPHLAGEAEVSAGSFEHDLLDRQIDNLAGNINFAGSQIELENLSGDYGAGNFEIGGNVLLNALMPDDIEFDIKANNIAFEHGSWSGKNTGEINISGDFLAPVISGELTALNTFFTLPFKWPTGDGEGEPPIQPEFDLTIRPGENVRVGNRNMDILVEDGSLTLSGSIADEIYLVGRLSSETGEVMYYNTLFELEEGSAEFRRNDFIPVLNINAFTELDGDRVELNLSGPADQMQFDVASDLGIAEEELLGRLAHQGGLGGILDQSYENIIQNEIMRLFSESLRLELFSRVERSFEETLDLDQFRIRSILSNQIEVEVGKFVMANLMLRYEHRFGIDETQSVGFEYYFDRGRQDLTIGGYYDSYSNYEFRLDTRIPF